jgi:hypothetical protein
MPCNHDVFTINASLISVSESCLGILSLVFHSEQTERSCSNYKVYDNGSSLLFIYTQNIAEIIYVTVIIRINY